jgi:hypothetical protein
MRGERRMTSTLFQRRGGTPFHHNLRRFARIRIPHDRGGRAPMRPSATDAAQYASDHAIGCIEAAAIFRCTPEAVREAWHRLFPGVAHQWRTPSAVERAVVYAHNHATTLRMAAKVFNVSPQDVCDAYNARFGTRRMLVGPVGLTVVWS